MQQAITPLKKIKHNHHTKILFEYSSKAEKQQHFLIQQTQLHTHITILINAQPANII